MHHGNRSACSSWPPAQWKYCTTFGPKCVGAHDTRCPFGVPPKVHVNLPITRWPRHPAIAKDIASLGTTGWKSGRTIEIQRHETAGQARPFYSIIGYQHAPPKDALSKAGGTSHHFKPSIMRRVVGWLPGHGHLPWTSALTQQLPSESCVGLSH
jgi:hypothetical protein